jgi:hypothetical protein
MLTLENGVKEYGNGLVEKKFMPGALLSSRSAARDALHKQHQAQPCFKPGNAAAAERCGFKIAGNAFPSRELAAIRRHAAHKLAHVGERAQLHDAGNC